MREQLIRYVDLLFAGAPNAVEIKQEILQNTLDRYDDLIDQGKAPEAAYRLAISGIGDINEILGGGHPEAAVNPVPVTAEPQETPLWKKVLRAFAVALYILCPIPLFVLSEIGMSTLGLCGLLTLVAVATLLMVIASNSEKEKTNETQATPQQELRKSINSVIWTVAVCVYLCLSFFTSAWHITWVIFPIAAAVKGIVWASLDLKEAQ